ncbi:MAG: tRNA dihydrouridine synthase DusB [Clostridia bacterium]|nr:tRNA dihydrouridine synthase DusB [Clostridia bacterium]
MIDFKNKIILAPMAGVTDYAFRKIAREYGADFCVSEMVSAKAMEFNDKKTGTLAEIREDDTPIGIQIFGHEPRCMANASYLLSRGLYEHTKSKILPETIDINMGCPVKKIVSAGDGSALMRDIDLASEIIKECVKASNAPVTVKFRAGWDKESINCVEFAKMAEDSGASAIAIHGRTRAQMYEPSANWDYIKAVKKAVKIPVIGNGDINSANDAIRMIEKTGVDSVMIGRGALGNPFIFKEIKAKMQGESYISPTAKEKINLALYHTRLMVEEKGEKTAIPEARKHISWYLRGLKGNAPVRVAINHALTYKEVEEILNDYYSALD